MKRFVLFGLGSLLLTLPVPAIIDTNSDGISDLWERQFNGDQLFDPPIDPAANPDSDGWTNAQEAAAGTNPFDANPPSGFIRPDIINIPAVWGDPDEYGNPVLITPETIRVNWQTIPGKQYTLLFSPDLSVWLPVGSAYVANGTITEYYFPLTEPTSNFWRVKIDDVDTDGDGVTDVEEIALGLDLAKPQSIAGIPDAWLALNFTDVLLNDGAYAIDPNGDPDSDGISTTEELQSGTNPNSADAAGSRQWITVNGNGAAQEVITRTGTLTIPAGKSAILVVAIASEEFPDWTEIQSQYNDHLEWHATPSQGASIDGSINVNERHVEWELDLIDGTSLPGLPSPVHIEQVRGLTAPPDADLTIQVEVSAMNFSDELLPSLVSVGLLPMEITWKAISGFYNVEDHTDPWTPFQIKGKRIFPDYKNPLDTELRDKLELVVKTSSTLIGKTIFVKAFDVDDSTDETFDREDSSPVIDIDGKNGGDNLTDYKNTPDNGQFWTGSAWGGYTANGLVDANGETKFIFGVGMQPGSNYRVVASIIDESNYSGVQTTNHSAAKYLGPETSQNGDTFASPLLTVWRRLWVENDSMTVIPVDTYGYKRNDLSWNLDTPVIRNRSYSSSTGTTSFGIDYITDQSSFLNLNALDFGQLIVQGISHRVVNTQSNTVHVSGDFTSVPVNSEFRLYDDDDRGLIDPPLPRVDLVNQQMKNYFKTAFIEVVDLGGFNLDKYIPFLPNENIESSSTTLADSKEPNVIDRNELWVCHLTAAYQGSMNSDTDPTGIDERLSYGETRFFGGSEHSVVYVENCRELYDYDPTLGGTNPVVTNQNLKKWITAVASHEMGHQPSTNTDGDTDHAELGLMAESLNNVQSHIPENAIFSPITVLRFRISNRWSE